MSNPLREAAIVLIRQQISTAEALSRIDGHISKAPSVKESDRAELRERVVRWNREAMVWAWVLKELIPAGTVEA